MLGAVDKPVSYIKQASDWTDVLDVQLETGSPVTHCDADRRTVATAWDAILNGRSGIGPITRFDVAMA